MDVDLTQCLVTRKGDRIVCPVHGGRIMDRDRPLDLIERLKRLSDRELAAEFERQTEATAWAIRGEMIFRWLKSLMRREPA